MSLHVVTVGAGGFGRETLDVLDAMAATGCGSMELLGVADDIPADHDLDRLVRRGVRYLGTVTELIQAQAPGAFVVGIGSPGVRRRIAQRLEAAGWEPTVLVHPS